MGGRTGCREGRPLGDRGARWGDSRVGGAGGAQCRHVRTAELMIPGEASPVGAEAMAATFKVVHDHADSVYLWDYERCRTPLVTLYNKAMSSQWNSVTDLDWDTDVDPEGLVDLQGPSMQLVRAAADEPGSPIASWDDAQFTALGIEMFTASISQFMHGEQGAMLTAAKIVETVPWIDAKYYAATQTMDEARHTEVFAKYLDLKVGPAYPMSPFLEEQITALLEDSRW